MDRSKKLLLIFGFSLALMALEAGGGILSHSLALLSDAGHMLTDSLSILLSYLAFRWSAKPANESKTFGYHRAEIIVAMINGLALAGVSVYIFIEAAHRFLHPEPIRVGLMLIVAAIGLAGNIFGLTLLHSESGDNLNVRGAFLHILGDTISSVGVIAGGVIIIFTGWTVVDALISVIIAGIVLRSAVNLIFESGEILLEGVPHDINLTLLKAEAGRIEGVRDIHDIHIWTITSGKHAMSAHLLIGNVSTRESQSIVSKARKMMEEKFNVTHTTFEVECDVCKDNACEFDHA